MYTYTDYYDTMVGVLYIICIVVISARATRTIVHINFIYIYILKMISEFCVFSTGRSGHVRSSSGDSLLCILYYIEKER